MTMSLIHTIICRNSRKTKSWYSSENPPDYAARRADELRRTRNIPVPKCVKIEKGSCGGVPVEYVSTAQNPTDRIILYIHGGGFVGGSTESRRMFTTYIASRMRYNTAAVDYRLAPEFPFPAAPQDCLAVYRQLVRRFAPDRIILLGESAGGNLVLSLLLQIKEARLPMPAAAVCLSPCVQYDHVLASYTENAASEAMVTNLAEEVADVYVCSHEKARLCNPLAAPYYGDFTNCPPICLWASESEILRDDSVILYEKLKKAGHPCRLYLRRGMIHTWMIMPFFSEAKKDLETIRQYIDSVLAGTLSWDAQMIRL